MYSPSFTRAVAIEAVLRRTVEGLGVRKHPTMTVTGNGDTAPVCLLSYELFRPLILLLMYIQPEEIVLFFLTTLNSFFRSSKRLEVRLCELEHRAQYSIRPENTKVSFHFHALVHTLTR